jgi:hypothetical protein
MLKWVQKWRHALFVVAMAMGMVLQSEDVGSYPSARYAATAIFVVTLVAWILANHFEAADERRAWRRHAIAEEGSSPRRNGGDAASKVFSVVSTIALTVAIVLTGVISQFSYLTGVSAESPKCAGSVWVEGYRLGIADLLAFPLVGAMFVVLIGVVASGRSKIIRSLLKVYDLPVLQFASIQITLGMSVIFSSVFVALVMLGTIAGLSSVRYSEIAKYCLPATALN